MKQVVSQGLDLLPETKTLIEMSYCIVTRQSQTHFNVSNCEGFSFTNFYEFLVPKETGTASVRECNKNLVLSNELMKVELQP